MNNFNNGLKWHTVAFQAYIWNAAMIKDCDFQLENLKFKIPAVIADELSSGLVNRKARNTIKRKWSKLGKRVLIWYILKVETREGSKIIKKETKVYIFFFPLPLLF